MSAAEALRAARAAGIKVTVDADGLLLEADAEPPQSILDALACSKPGIMALLRGWSAEDWQAYFDERAGIAEFEAGLSRSDAEARAFDCCVTEWLNHYLVSSPPGRCLCCREVSFPDSPLVPFGTAWFHSHCWAAWYSCRKAEAVAALKAMGINPGCSDPHSSGHSRRQICRAAD